MNGDLDYNVFNENVLPYQASAFWEIFINQFIFNNNIGMIEYFNSGDTNNGSIPHDNSRKSIYNDDSVLNRIEWFKDLLCFIFEMLDNSTDFHPKFDILNQDSWNSNNNKNNWQQILINIVNDVKSDENRKTKIIKLIDVMFYDFKKEFLHNGLGILCVDNNFLNGHLFSAIYNAIFLHNDKFNNSLKPQLNHIPAQLVRLLILTVNFIVECESGFGITLKCLHFDASKTSVQRIITELKTFHIDKYWTENWSKVHELFTNKRINTNGLTTTEIGCLKLWTNDHFYKIIKKGHRCGATCHFRSISMQIRNALIKLKQHSQFSSFSQGIMKHIYCGVADVFVPAPKNLNNLHENDLSIANPSMQIQISDTYEEFPFLTYDTFTSFSNNASVALWFAGLSEHRINEANATRGILFVMDFEDLVLNPELMHGSIEWLSDFGGESEILVGPCKLRIHRLDKDKWDQYWPKNIDRDRYPGIELFRVELMASEHISSIRKLKEQATKTWSH